MQHVTKHLVIRGRVQGVSYRYSLRQVAQELQLKGWCRNVPDGSVEACVSGADTDVERMISWCYQGPPLAQVSAVMVTDIELPPEELPQPFEIWK